MQNPRLAGRYAKSLVDLAQERNELEAVYADMKYLQDVCRQSKEFTNVLRSPVINADTKEKIINEIISKNISKLSSSFVNLIVKKGREKTLPEIASAVVEQYNGIKGIYKVKLITVSPASDELKAAIVNKLKEDAGLTQVELENVVNDKIIGGFQLEYKGNLVDASIYRDLRDIQKQFKKNTYIRNIR